MQEKKLYHGGENWKIKRFEHWIKCQAVSNFHWIMTRQRTNFCETFVTKKIERIAQFISFHKSIFSPVKLVLIVISISLITLFAQVHVFLKICNVFNSQLAKLKTIIFKLDCLFRWGGEGVVSDSVRPFNILVVNRAISIHCLWTCEFFKEKLVWSFHWK